MHKQRRFVEVALCLIILGLALALRVRRLDTTGMWGDQSFTLNTAMRWVNGGEMPLAANKSSIGVTNPPLIEYLYAAALWVWPDVLSVAVLTMIAGLAAVAVAGWAAYKVFGKRAALWTMLLFAVNPWSVFYSQLIWNQTLVPIFATLMLACLLVYFAAEQRPVYLLLSFVWAACMTQVHPGSAPLLLAMGLVGVLFWRKLRAWPLLVGGALFVLLYVPFLMYENGVGWIDVRAALEVSRQPAPFSPAALLVSLDLQHARGLLPYVRYIAQFDTLALLLLALALAYALWRGPGAFMRRRDPETTRKAAGLCILLVWFALPILFYLRSAHYLQIYYLIGQLPAHFILIGAGLGEVQSRLERSTQRAAQIAAWAVLPLLPIALAAWQFGFNVQFQDSRLSNPGPMQIRHARAAIQTSRRLLAEYPGCDLVAVSRGYSHESSELALLHGFVSQEHVLLADGQLAVAIPAPCAIYLDAWPTSRASTWLATAATPLPDATIPVLGETWRFYSLSAEAQTEPPARLAQWANGVALTGYARGDLRPGATLPLTLTWSVETSSPEIEYHFGTYLLAADNQVVAQSDGPGFDSIQWRAGDRFITWFDFPVPQDLPPGEYQIAVALYTWPTLERIDLASGGNTAFLERVRQ
jgi:hypothetical protein